MYRVHAGLELGSIEYMPTTPTVPLGVIPIWARRASVRSFPEPAWVIRASSSSRLVMNIPSLPPSIVWLFAVVMTRIPIALKSSMIDLGPPVGGPW